MEILRTISLYAEAKKIPFLIIGGHAINYYGFSRQTGDVDLLVKLADKNWWIELFNKLKYEVSQNDDKFIRMRAKTLAAWPIDFMLVDDNTFDKLNNHSVQATLGVADVRVVSPNHLVTLKLHALRHYQEHRFQKDYNDIIWLLRNKKTTLDDNEIKELCLKYATLEIYEKIRQDLSYDPKR
ncbi:MAG: nucleotidyltransferase [Proteobacteria bacterium]|nr:nucleotidyltransferase [Pseudomonadota bacterium]